MGHGSNYIQANWVGLCSSIAALFKHGCQYWCSLCLGGPYFESDLVVLLSVNLFLD